MLARNTETVVEKFCSCPKDQAKKHLLPFSVGMVNVQNFKKPSINDCNNTSKDDIDTIFLLRKWRIIGFVFLRNMSCCGGPFTQPRWRKWTNPRQVRWDENSSRHLKICLEIRSPGSWRQSKKCEATFFPNNETEKAGVANTSKTSFKENNSMDLDVMELLAIPTVFSRVGSRNCEFR